MKNATIATALAKAQANMGKAIKQATNPHFRSKYADLGSVVDACMPALNEAGIAVIQPTGEEGGQRFVETIFIHGESGERLSCRVPLIAAKNDMQGFGSAVTYARRYGLMTMAGIAPEDDDGNAAKNAPPTERDLAPPAPSKEAIEIAIESLRNADAVEQLRAIFKDFPPDVRAHADVIKAGTDRKDALEAEVKHDAAVKAEQSSAPLVDDEIKY